MQGMLEMMMTSLMSKEVLYEPLKELGDKVRFMFLCLVLHRSLSTISSTLTHIHTYPQFPPYLAENATKISAEDKSRFESQLDRLNQIIKAFEEPKYSDADKEKTAEIMELMGEVRLRFFFFFAFDFCSFMIRMFGFEWQHSVRPYSCLGPPTFIASLHLLYLSIKDDKTLTQNLSDSSYRCKVSVTHPLRSWEIFRQDSTLAQMVCHNCQRGVVFHEIPGRFL
jgi:hypothetical protein